MFLRRDFETATERVIGGLESTKLMSPEEKKVVGKDGAPMLHIYLDISSSRIRKNRVYRRMSHDIHRLLSCNHDSPLSTIL